MWNLNLNLNQNLNQNQTQTPIQTQNQTQIQTQILLLTADFIYLIKAAPFTHIIKQKNVQMFAVTMQNIKYILIKKKHSDSADLLSIIYYEFLNVFSHNKADTLSSHQSQDHVINLISEAESKHGSLYFMITDELKMLKKWLNENL